LADDHRHFVDPDLQTIEHRLHSGLGLHVVVRERFPVPRQELLDPLRAQRMPGPEEDQVVVRLIDQRHAPEDEGAQEDLAQLRIALHHCVETVAVQSDDGPVGGDPAAGPGPPRRKHVDLTRELARSEQRDRLFPAGDRADDFDPSADHHEEVGVLVAGLEQELPGLDAAVLAGSRDARELGIGETREYLLVSVHVPGWICYGDTIRNRSCQLVPGGLRVASSCAGAASRTSDGRRDRR